MARTQSRKARQNGVYDLAAHRLAGRFDVAIVSPDGTPTPVTITLCSRYGKEYRARQVEAEREKIESASGKSAPLDATAVAENFILDLMVGLTVGWSGIVVDGEDWDCTPAKVRELYTADGLGWIYDQVADAYLRRERFFTAPSDS